MSDQSSTPVDPKYAWREVAQQDLPRRPAPERVRDFFEIHGLFDEATAREQASRCIQCPNPSCVSGCPLCNPIPQWMQLTAEGRFLEAAAVLGSVTNMAEICTRVCPSEHLCEGRCILDSVAEPVSIKAIEQFLVDYAFAHGAVDASTPPPNGLQVAVLGSGPAGLACAEDLARKGYTVTVFDSSLVPGGLLVNGIPPFKLDHSVVERRVELLRKRGVVFQLGVKLWEELTLGQLTQQFNAVFLGLDARKARPLEVPGAELRGVVPALAFLVQKSTPASLDQPPIDVAGKRVVVLGAGDTAMDCLRAALRYGASSVLCVYRRDETDMPCARGEYRDAIEEGAQFLFLASPVRVIGNEQGTVRGVRLVRTEMEPGPEDARRLFKTLPGTEFDLEADLVITALGFDAEPCPRTEDLNRLALNEAGQIVVDASGMTSILGVFAGGDMVRGPSLVVETVRDARKAAEQIDQYLVTRKT